MEQRHSSLQQVIALTAAAWLLSGCVVGPIGDPGRPLSNSLYLPETNASIEIPQLTNCTHEDDSIVQLNTELPVTVIVHGCFSSAGRFRSLADVFAFHGQQTICFNYDDRDSITQSSAELIAAIEQLAAVMDHSDITVIGHSQGGLVARRAFIDERVDRFSSDDVQLSLVTISTPFGGIEAAAHCDWTALKWLSLGLVHPICQIVTGSKYREIPPGSEFIENPGELIPSVTSHLRIITDETGSCRDLAEDGECLEDDFVFSVEEQIQPDVERASGLVGVEVVAGHVEIVGEAGVTPTKLMAILQQGGVLNPTPEGMSEEFAALLADLYLSPNPRD